MDDIIVIEEADVIFGKTKPSTEFMTMLKDIWKTPVSELLPGVSKWEREYFGMKTTTNKRKVLKKPVKFKNKLEGILYE